MGTRILANLLLLFRLIILIWIWLCTVHLYCRNFAFYHFLLPPLVFLKNSRIWQFFHHYFLRNNYYLRWGSWDSCIYYVKFLWSNWRFHTVFRPWKDMLLSRTLKFSLLFVWISEVIDISNVLLNEFLPFDGHATQRFICDTVLSLN